MASRKLSSPQSETPEARRLRTALEGYVVKQNDPLAVRMKQLRDDATAFGKQSQDFVVKLID